MKNKLSIFLLMVSMLVVAHAIIPHHHHSNRIYLVLEEEHEHPNGHDEKDEGTCHHGNHPDELLICAAKSLEFSQFQSFEMVSVAVRNDNDILPTPQTIKINTNKALSPHFLPSSPLREKSQLRAPPTIEYFA